MCVSGYVISCVAIFSMLCGYMLGRYYRMVIPELMSECGGQWFLVFVLHVIIHLASNCSCGSVECTYCCWCI